MTPRRTSGNTAHARIFAKHLARMLACAALLACANPLFAQVQIPARPLTPPAPLGAAPAPASGPETALELDARRALEIGLPSIAAGIHRRLLADPAITSAAVRNRISLALASALIEDDLIEDAAKALQEFSGPPTPALHLRQAMIDARRRNFDAARTLAETLRPEDLSPEDRSWLFFLRGLLAEEARDSKQAGALYQQAESAAVTPSQRAWFILSRTRTQLFLGEASDNIVSTLRQTLERNAGRPLGYEAAKQLAVALNALGRRGEAVTLLQTQLQFLAPQETVIRDDWRFLLGVIAGPDNETGRDSLSKLLVNSADRDKQRAALRLLASAPGRASDFRKLLDQLIAATPPHPILSDLLLFRAQLSLADKNTEAYISAENDANRLLTQFPGSQLRTPALGLLAASAWEQGRYRAAASQATAARAELPPGVTHAQLGVLIAEAYFRAKDFRNASAAYGVALAEVPEGIEPGMLMYQRVLAEMQAGSNGSSLDSAQKILDQHAADPRFDPVNRWKAEWNLVRALQAANETKQAYERVNQLLAAAASTLPVDLRARMAWLQTRLAYDSGDYKQTFALAEKLIASLDGVEPDLRDNIISTTMLLEAQAGFALNQSDPAAAKTATDTLRTLRARYPKTDAAIYSYIVEADAAANRGLLVEAQSLLLKLADDYRSTAYAPYALYQAALYAERRGQAQYSEEAYKILERLIENYKDSELVFYTRMKQGNILRSLNQPGAAENLYAELVNRYKFPEYPEALMAELALADSYATSAVSDSSRAESAATIYERLLDLPAAPLDLRTEAGYKFGRNLIAREEYARLETTWWPMINSFLLEDANAARLGSKGRYWMARALLDLGGVLEQQSKIREARKVYELIILKNLPGAALAQDRISRGSR